MKHNSHKPANRLSRLSVATNRLSVATFASNRSNGRPLSSHSNNYKRMSTAISIRTTEKKRMSIISATSLSSLSSYQQERMMAKASNLSNALSKARTKS